MHTFKIVAVLLFGTFLMYSCCCETGSVNAKLVWSSQIKPCPDYPPDTCLAMSIYRIDNDFSALKYISFAEDYPPDTIFVNYPDLCLGEYRIALERIDEDYLTSGGSSGTKTVIFWYTGKIDTVGSIPEISSAEVIELTSDQKTADALIEIH